MRNVAGIVILALAVTVIGVTLGGNYVIASLGLDALVLACLIWGRPPKHL